MYLEQCGEDGRVTRVDCSDEQGQMLPPDEIFAKIKALVDSRFGLQN